MIFPLWDESKRNHFLVNDLPGLWPRDELLPQRPYCFDLPLLDPEPDTASAPKRMRVRR